MPSTSLKPSHPNQHFFPFIPQVEVVIRQENWIKIANKPKHISCSDHLKLKSLLENKHQPLPLFELYDESERLVEAIGNDLSNNMDDSDPYENQDLSDRQIRLLHAQLLHQSIESLVNTKCNVERAEILTWMYQSVIPDHVTRDRGDGQEIIHIPFTFGACCYLNGRDPYDLRERYMSYWTQFKSKQLSFLTNENQPIGHPNGKPIY